MLITLVCVYLGSWQLTRRQGAARIVSYLNQRAIEVNSTSSPVPFLVVVNQSVEGSQTNDFISVISSYPQASYPQTSDQDRYYLWCGGPVLALPGPISEFCERCKERWHELVRPSTPNHMTPQRVHGGVI